MYCPECLVILVKSNLLEHIPEDKGDYYYKEYYCFDCNTLYVCTSQTGDYNQDNLEIVDL